MPAALLAVGLVLAWRERWALSGVVLGIGTLVKWTPALAAVALVAWLSPAGASRRAAMHALAAAGTVALVYVPFLVWSPTEVLAAYSRQSGRSITPESVWYLAAAPVRPRARAHAHLVLGRCAALGERRAPWPFRSLRCCVVFAAAVRARAAFVRRSRSPPCAPAVFLLTNRIFSPQFVLVAFAAWAIAAALVVRTRREQLAVGSRWAPRRSRTRSSTRSRSRATTSRGRCAPPWSSASGSG